MNLLPNYENAFISKEKIYEYVLSEKHIEGRHKATVFRKKLGITSEDAIWLIEEILKGISQNPCELKGVNLYGERYAVDMKLVNENKSAWVRTAWIIRYKEKFPRLTSCYIMK